MAEPRQRLNTYQMRYFYHISVKINSNSLSTGKPMGDNILSKQRFQTSVRQTCAFRLFLVFALNNLADHSEFFFLLEQYVCLY